jgi:CheY-like chemotaxis protein
MPKKQALPRGDGEAILVVEDNVLVNESIVTILSQLGYLVISAEDGQNAMDAISETKFSPDLLLTDIMLPGIMNGREVSEEVLAHHPDCGVVYMSGYSADALSDQNLLPQGYESLSKPFTGAVLAETIRSALDNHAH